MLPGEVEHTMTVVGHPAHGFVPISALFFTHVFVAALPAVLVWFVFPRPIVATLAFAVAAGLLTPLFRPWYHRLHPQHESAEN